MVQGVGRSQVAVHVEQGAGDPLAHRILGIRTRVADVDHLGHDGSEMERDLGSGQRLSIAESSLPQQDNSVEITLP